MRLSTFVLSLVLLLCACSLPNKERIVSVNMRIDTTVVVTYTNIHGGYTSEEFTPSPESLGLHVGDSIMITGGIIIRKHIGKP